MSQRGRAPAPPPWPPAAAGGQIVHCTGCGRAVHDGEHAECHRRQQASDPPRYCASCGRRLVVQILPRSWRARCVACGELAPPGPG